LAGFFGWQKKGPDVVAEKAREQEIPARVRKADIPATRRYIPRPA